MHTRRPEADGKKKRTGIFILFGFLLVLIAYVLYLCISDVDRICYYEKTGQD